MTPRKFPLFAIAFALALPALFTCEEVPQYCGNGMLYDPGCDFCFGSKAYRMCGDGKYNPLVNGCDDNNLIGTRCSDGTVVPLGTPCGGYTLTTSAAPEIGGTLITPTPPKDGRPTYPAKQDVVLIATANADYKFAGWAGAQPTESNEAGSVTTAKYTMNANMPQITIVAVFKPVGKGKLITDAFPKTGGTVSCAPEKETYNDGEEVSVKATPAAGYAFAGWSGANSSKNNPTTLVMDESKTLIAMFTPVAYTIKTSVEPPEGGAVYINGNALLAGDESLVGTEIEVLAREADGYRFIGWSGAAAFGNKDNINTTVKLTADAAITARFEQGEGRGTGTQTFTYTLTVDKNPPGGKVSIEPDQTTYTSGTHVTATAAADVEYDFIGWSGAATGATPSVMIYMTGNKTLTAMFQRRGGTPPNNGSNFSETAVSGSPFDMVFVPGGTFTMGCTIEQGSDCWDWESPSHSVTLNGYYIGKYEVTQGLWKAVMGSNNNPSYFTGGDNLPVETVSLDDVQGFITALNNKTGKKYRLPTEAEWEYAARGGQSGGTMYSGSNTIGDVAWYSSNSGSTTHAVGTKSANGLGIYDMSGNVYEWVNDWYGSYSSNAQTNPTGPTTGSYRVRRGGGWGSGARYCRVSFRSNDNPADRRNDIGFRLAVSP